jgi:hypothetical protein
MNTDPEKFQVRTEKAHSKEKLEGHDLTTADQFPTPHFQKSTHFLI